MPSNTLQELLRNTELVLVPRGTPIAGPAPLREGARRIVAIEAALTTFGFTVERDLGKIRVIRQGVGGMEELGNGQFDEETELKKHLKRAGVAGAGSLLLNGYLDEHSLDTTVSARELWFRLVSLRDEERHRHTEHVGLGEEYPQDAGEVLPRARIPTWFIDPELAGVTAWLNGVGVLTSMTCVSPPPGHSPNAPIIHVSQCLPWAKLVLEICGFREFMRVYATRSRIKFRLPTSIPLAALAHGMLVAMHQSERGVHQALMQIRRRVERGSEVDDAIAHVSERLSARRAGRNRRHRNEELPFPPGGAPREDA